MEQFLVSHDRTGALRWSRQLPSTSGASALRLAVDADGNVYVAGAFDRPGDLGSGPVASAGGHDGFVASFDADGRPRWSRHFGDAASDAASGVAVDAAGNVYATGWIAGTADFGDGAPRSTDGTSDIDVFVAGWDAGGAGLWSLTVGCGAAELGTGLAADPAGNLYVTGLFRVDVDFGSGTVETPVGGFDAFLASFDRGGAYRWSRGYGAAAHELASDVAADGGGRAYVTGLVAQTVDETMPVVSTGESAFLAGFGQGGAMQWSKTLGAGGYSVEGVAVDAAGNAFVTGAFQGTVDLGGGPITSAGGRDAFVASYDPAGVLRWARSFGAAGDDGGSDAFLTPDGALLVTGWFSGSVDFGAGARTSAGLRDVFVVALQP
jgi:hypothetical protein